MVGLKSDNKYNEKKTRILSRSSAYLVFFSIVRQIQLPFATRTDTDKPFATA